jgi:hypothetical protein
MSMFNKGMFSQAPKSNTMVEGASGVVEPGNLDIYKRPIDKKDYVMWGSRRPEKTINIV